MINKLFLKIIFAVLITVFTACGSGGSASSDNQKTVIDIVLNVGESLLCTSATTFTVVPSVEEPIVIFTQDAENGDTKIELDENTFGTLSISGCTQK